MTDWFGVADTAASIEAGLDLEMPGPGRAYGPALAAALTSGSVAEADVDAAVHRLLETFDRVGALDDTADIALEPPSSGDVALMRRAAADAMVLLHNDGTLPLDVGSLRHVAVIGPNAQAACIMGGGSAEVTPYPAQSPLDALRSALGADVTVTYARGCDIDRSPSPLGAPGLPTVAGFDVDVFAAAEPTGEPVDRFHVDTLRVLQFGGFEPTANSGASSMRIRGSVVAPEAGDYTFALSQAGGTAQVTVAGAVVLDGVTNPPPPGGTEFFGMGTQDLVGTVDLEAGVPTDVEVTLTTESDFAFGVRVGFRLPGVPDLLERAVDAATAAELAVVVVGTNREWESEGHDRDDFALPGDQAELIRRVSATGRPTVVVINAAAPVDLSWCEDVNATVQCWFGGQEQGPAIADVLTGAAEPGGRLPTTIPMQIEHNPSYDNFPGENGEVRYGESIFMGYRGYEHRAIAPRFAFGHGLGYTTFTLGAPSISATAFSPGTSVTVSVPVSNTGTRAGSTVVQCYVAPARRNGSPRLVRPPKELKAFAKVRLEPGQTEAVELVLDDRSFASWDPGQPHQPDLESRLGAGAGFVPAAGERRAPGWYVDPGKYEILIGTSSVDIAARCPIEVKVDR
jgi:beta-glucosidase